MEHNFTFNSAAEITLIRDILAPIFNDYATYQAMRNIVSFGGMAMPDINNYSDVSIRELLDRLDNAITKAEEDENPKPEHRYSVTNCDWEIHEEYDDLNEAWKFYRHLYFEDMTNGYFRSEGAYTLRDEWLDEEITSAVPMIEVEGNWEADIRMDVCGERVDFEDMPYWLQDTIGDCIRGGDTYGSYDETVGDIEWDDIANWEEEHDETESEVSTDAEEESTEA